MWDADEHTIYANPKFLKLVGYELSEIIGKESYMFWDRASIKTVKKENSKRKKWDSSSYEWNLLSKSWEIIPVKIIGTPLEDWGTIWIMSDQREYLKKVESEAILAQAVEQSTDAIILVDPDWNICSWNNGANHIFWFKKKIIGKHLSCLFQESDIENILQIKDLVNKYELYGKHKSWSSVSVSITQTHIKTQDKRNILYYLLTCRDISNYRKIETEIRDKYEKIKAVYTELWIKKRQLEYIHDLIDFAKDNRNDLKRICDYIVASAVMLTEVDGCEMLILDNSKKEFAIISHIGLSEDWTWKKFIPFEWSLTQQAVERWESLKIFDLHSEILYTRKNLARKNQLTSLLIIPIMLDGRCLGTLWLYTKADKKLEIFENDFIEQYAEVVSLVLPQS